MSELMKPLETITTVNCDQSLLEVVKLLETQEEVKQLTVVRENGVVVGLLEKASIITLLQQQAQTTPA
ncbi:MAG: CBS domain-containing protein [Xenococcaceae cyanobacterium]